MSEGGEGVLEKLGWEDNYENEVGSHSKCSRLGSARRGSEWTDRAPRPGQRKQQPPVAPNDPSGGRTVGQLLLPG